MAGPAGFQLPLIIFPQDGEERAVGFEAYNDPVDPDLPAEEDSETLPPDHPLNPKTRGLSFQRCLNAKLWQSITVLLHVPCSPLTAIFATAEGGIGCLQPLLEPEVQAIQCLEETLLGNCAIGPEQGVLPRATAHHHNTNWCSYTLSDPYADAHNSGLGGLSTYWVQWSLELTRQALPVDSGQLLKLLSLLDACGVFACEVTSRDGLCKGSIPRKPWPGEEQQHKALNFAPECDGVGRVPDRLCSELTARYFDLSNSDKHTLALIHQSGVLYTVQAFRRRRRGTPDA
jgi:hypothetical protein